MDTAKRVQILHEAVYISHSSNILGIDVNTIILPPAMDRLGSLTLVWQPVQEKENSEFKRVELRLKFICVSSY